ncbi:type I restriction endonuclease subunit R, partial [Fervidicoccus fontis]|uniref:type I restriction endonuclease subunit R n=1 Tax=Fervidicoccus fontis TaxID=683846 RepID=UPI002352955C
IQENQFIEDFIEWSIFEKAFKKINEDQLKDLKEEKKNEILSYVKDRLKDDDEKKILRYLKDGIDYYSPKTSSMKFFLIDYDNIKNNTFVWAPQVKFKGFPENIKPDYTLFINGIPLVIIEAKSTTRIDSYEEGLEQIKRYQEESPNLFKYVQFGVAYGDKRVYIPTWPNMSHEKRITIPFGWKVRKNNGLEEDDIFELLKPTNVLNLIKWYTFFFKDRSGKIIARYNQFYASEKALERISDYLSEKSQKNRGLIWHWQGSGKTYTMIFLANKYFKTYFSRNPILFFLLDREDLQKQLLEDFISKLDLAPFDSYIKKIESIQELKEELNKIRESLDKHSIIIKKIYIVLIQKFRKENFEEFLNDFNAINKKEVVFLIDEAHRSQYGTLASVIKNIFPQAIKFAFTGTPIFKYEEKNTFREFGYEDEPYLHVYFIKDSIGDGFTIPLVYDVINEGKKEADGIQILLKDEEIREFIKNWENITDQEYEETLEEMQKPINITENQIRRNLNKMRIILSNEERIKKLAKFIAQRIKDDTENFRYKVMVVMVNRESCVRMKKYLDKELETIFNGQNVEDWSEVVITYEQNDIGDILDYKSKLRKKYLNMEYDEINRAIQDKFKKQENPKILIVTDMLITGFDAPILRVMYLDKPLYDHRLLQAIARVNRPYTDNLGEKKFGMVVDSVGLLQYVKKSIDSYEILAREDLQIDLLKNVFYDIDSRAKDFEENLKLLKNELKNLRYKDEDFSFDIDNLKEAYKRDSKTFKTHLDNLIPKIKRMVLYWDMISVMGKIHEVVEEFKALGPHKIRVKYEDDIAILNYIYLLIYKNIRGEVLPKEFWNGLIEIIHNKTIVKDFQPIVKYEINSEMEIDPRTAIKILSVNPNEEKIADAYNILRLFLSKNISNPIYKVIYDRLEQIRKEWVKRNVDIETLKNKLKLEVEDVENYRKNIEGKSP